MGRRLAAEAEALALPAGLVRRALDQVAEERGPEWRRLLR